MSDKHFTQAEQILHQQYKRYLDEVAVQMGRTNSRDNRVDWQAVNEKMIAWWAEKGYRFP